MHDYPPEFDSPEFCEVCGRRIDCKTTECDCPECPVCGEVGNPDCYRQGHMEPAKDSIKAFCDHIGISPLKDALRAIDKHNIEHVWLILHTTHPMMPHRSGTYITYDEDDAVFDSLPDHFRVKGVGVGGIAWDGTNWEWSEEEDLNGRGFEEVVPRLREKFHEALKEHRSEYEHNYDVRFRAMDEKKD